jgi:hypothetical protein
MADAGGFGWSEAVSALVGAGIALAFDSIREKIGRHRDEADKGNGALLTMAQMYAQLRNVWKQVYEKPAQVATQQGRSLHPFEVRPLTSVPDDGLRLNLAELSFLLRSHDPDLPSRLAALESAFLTHRTVENERTRLALLRLRRLATNGP